MRKIEVIHNWRHCWKLTSIWVFVVIGTFPDIYNAVVAAGLHDELPEAAKTCLRILAVAGIALRLIKQNVNKAVTNEQDSSH